MTKKMGIGTGYEGIHRMHDTSVFDKHVLSSGVTVWLQKSPILVNEDGVIAVVLPGIGALRDPEHAPGAAHFFEHLPFKGTPMHPNIHALYEAIDRKGGEANAATAMEWTRYHVILFREHMKLAFKAALELSTNPLLRDEDIKTERGVIRSELERKLTNGDSRAAWDINKILFNGHPLANLVLGTFESIDTMERETLVDFQSSYYRAENIHVVVGGTFVQEKGVLELLEKLTADLPKRSVALSPLATPPYRKHGECRLSDARYGRDGFGLSWLIEPTDDPVDMRALSLLAGSLGHGSHSPLVSEIRDRLGLTYNTTLADAAWHPSNMWSLDVTIPVPREHFGTVEKIWHDALRDLKPETVRAEQAENQLVRRGDFVNPVSAAIGSVRDLVKWGRIKTFMEDDDLDDAVTMEQVLKWRDHLTNTPPFRMEILSG